MPSGTAQPNAVVVASGHLIDAPNRADPRFPPEAEQAVAARIDALFDSWGLGASDLLFTGGARGADILFAEAALRRGAHVRLLLALPPDAFVARSVALPGTSWERRFRDLLRQCPVEVLPDQDSDQSPFEPVNAWMVHEARQLSASGQLVGALVWDGKPSSRPGGVAHMAELLRRHGIPATIIDPGSR